MNNRVDICVLTVGRFDMLKKCLDAIEKVLEITPCNVYVFDNGSPKDKRIEAAEVLNRPFLTRVKRHNTMLGFSEGANTVIRMGTAPMVMFVTDDIMLKPNAVDVLVKRMDMEKTIGQCGLKLLFPMDGHNGPGGTVQHIGHAINLKGEVVHPLIGWSADNPRCCISGDRFSVTGGTFMVRRNVFEKVNGFNPIYGAGYFEDVELSLNIRDAGYRIYCDTDAIGEHYVGASFELHKNSPIQKNRQLFLDRNKNRLEWTEWLIR